MYADRLRQPQLVQDLVRSVKSRLGEHFPVHIKIRVDDDPKCALSHLHLR